MFDILGIIAFLAMSYCLIMLIASIFSLKVNRKLWGLICGISIFLLFTFYFLDQKFDAGKTDIEIDYSDVVLETPTPEATMTPTPEPTATPMVIPTMEPEEPRRTHTPEPTKKPTPQPTKKPTPTPEPTPDEAPVPSDVQEQEPATPPQGTVPIHPKPSAGTAEEGQPQ